MTTLTGGAITTKGTENMRSRMLHRLTWLAAALSLGPTSTLSCATTRWAGADRPPLLANLAEPIAYLGVVPPRLEQRLGGPAASTGLPAVGGSSSVGGGV